MSPYVKWAGLGIAGAIVIGIVVLVILENRTQSKMDDLEQRAATRIALTTIRDIQGIYEMKRVAIRQSCSLDIFRSNYIAAIDDLEIIGDGLGLEEGKSIELKLKEVVSSGDEGVSVYEFAVDGLPVDLGLGETLIKDNWVYESGEWWIDSLDGCGKVIGGKHEKEA